MAEILGMPRTETKPGQHAPFVFAAEIFDVNNPEIHVNGVEPDGDSSGFGHYFRGRTLDISVVPIDRVEEPIRAGGPLLPPPLAAPAAPTQPR